MIPEASSASTRFGLQDQHPTVLGIVRQAGGIDNDRQPPILGGPDHDMQECRPRTRRCRQIGRRVRLRRFEIVNVPVRADAFDVRWLLEFPRLQQPFPHSSDTTTDWNSTQPMQNPVDQFPMQRGIHRRSHFVNDAHEQMGVSTGDPADKPLFRGGRTAFVDNYHAVVNSGLAQQPPDDSTVGVIADHADERRHPPPVLAPECRHGLRASQC